MKSSSNVFPIGTPKAKVDISAANTYTIKGGAKTTDGGGGDGMELRIARLESDVHHIQSDIRDIKSDIKEIKSDMKHDYREIKSEMKKDLFIMLGAIATLAGIIAKGFGWY